MLVWGVKNEESLHSLAEQVDVRLWEVKARGKAIQFTLRPRGETYRKTGLRGRRVNAVCWHGHLAFYDKLFAAFPGAKVQTSMVTYEGQDEFMAKNRSTFRHQEGPGGHPSLYGHGCKCGEESSGGGG